MYIYIYDIVTYRKFFLFLFSGILLWLKLSCLMLWQWWFDFILVAFFDLKDLKDDIFGPVLLAFDLLQDVQELQTDWSQSSFDFVAC